MLGMTWDEVGINFFKLWTRNVPVAAEETKRINPDSREWNHWPLIKKRKPVRFDCCTFRPIESHISAVKSIAWHARWAKTGVHFRMRIFCLISTRQKTNFVPCCVYSESHNIYYCYAFRHLFCAVIRKYLLVTVNLHTPRMFRIFHCIGNQNN